MRYPVKAGEAETVALREKERPLFWQAATAAPSIIMFWEPGSKMTVLPTLKY